MANIKFTGVHKSFGSNKIITDFNLLGKEDEFLVLVGPSGCGKSTLLRMIAGLEKIDEGEIFINDQKINELHPSKRQTAMVFQSYALYPHMNVYENMSFGLKIEKRPKEEINTKVMQAAKILKIEELLERKPKQLSGGQRQRVAIGRAITRNPKIFLFDEPLSNLDAALRVQMRIELAKLHEHLDTTMVYVTHDQTEAMTLSSEIVVLDQGEISQQGEPLNLYNKPSNTFVAGFIGSPKMNFIPSKFLSNSSSQVEINTLGSNFTLPKKLKDKDIEAELIFGIRPEDMHLGSDNDFHWQSKVFVTEKLGSSTFIYLEGEKEPIVMEVAGDTAIKVGDIVKVKLDLEKTHLFNSQNLSVLE